MHIRASHQSIGVNPFNYLRGTVALKKWDFHIQIGTIKVHISHQHFNDSLVHYEFYCTVLLSVLAIFRSFVGVSRS